MDHQRANSSEGWSRTAAGKEKTSVEGNQNTVVNTGDVGGNVHIGDITEIPDNGFFTPILDQFASGNWVNPPQAGKLVDLLAEHRLLFLAGDLDDNSDRARHLACLLRCRLQVDPSREVKVLERARSKEPQTIEIALDTETPTILLLVELSPRQFNTYTWSSLRSLLHSRQGYAILTTNHGHTEWAIASGSLESRLWIELSWDAYYGIPLLSEFLVSRLAASDRPPRQDLLPETSGEPQLIEGMPLAGVVAILRTPERICGFVDWLLRAPDPVPLDAIKEQLAQRAGDEQAVRQWYRKFEARNQLLLVGLTLLDGLPEDLVFSGLELLVSSIWRRSDPNLPQFDYCDLAQFAVYFRIIKTDGGLVRIQSGSRKLREHILKVAWDLQRRRLLATLPALTEMIRASAASTEEPLVIEPGKAAAESIPQSGTATALEATSRAFNRSPDGTVQLDQAMVESLSLIGLLSIEVVEPYLLELAADPAKPVRQLAARALAAWRESGHEIELFHRLHGWWAEACETDEPGSRIERLRSQEEDPHAAVRATVALAVGYAARYDRSNQMDSRLLALTINFLQDRHPQVREAAAEALYYIVAWHFRQVEPLLRTQVLKSRDFIAPVAQGAAAACRLRIEETLAILDNWRAYGRSERQRSSPAKISVREHLLATAALTYGFIQLESDQGLLRPEVVVANIHSLLMEELHLFVRHYAFTALELQAERNFETVIQLLQDLLAQIHLQDRPAVVGVFTRTYLLQRHQLRGGDRRIEVAGVLYDVWTSSPRPLTEIEATLYGWLLDSSRPIVQQLAVDIFDRLGRTELEVAEKKLPVVRQEIPGVPQTETLKGRPQRQVRGLPIAGSLAIFCVAPRKPKVRSTLKPLLAEMIALKKPPATPPRVPASSSPPRPPDVSRPPAEVLFERWGAMPNDATRAVADLLRRAFSLYRWRWLILFSALAAGFSLYKGIPLAVHAVMEARAATAQSSPAAPSPGETSDAMPEPSNP